MMINNNDNMNTEVTVPETLEEIFDREIKNYEDLSDKRKKIVEDNKAMASEVVDNIMKQLSFLETKKVAKVYRDWDYTSFFIDFGVERWKAYLMKKSATVVLDGHEETFDIYDCDSVKLYVYTSYDLAASLQKEFECTPEKLVEEIAKFIFLKFCK